MITLNQDEQDLILKNKDLFDQGKMDEFWHEIEYAAPHSEYVSYMTHITQFLRQYFTDEQLIETYVPPYFFYFDKNPVWIDGVVTCDEDSYNPVTLVHQSVDLSNFKRSWECLPYFQHFVLNNQAITASNLSHNTFNVFSAKQCWKKYKKHITITDTTISITGDYSSDFSVDFDFSKITDPTILKDIYSKIYFGVFSSSDYCIFPDLPTVYFPKTKGWFNPILEADEIEFGKNTVDIKFSNVRSDMIKVKKFIVHNRKAYKIISDAIKYKHLNSTVELV